MGLVGFSGCRGFELRALRLTVEAKKLETP